MKFWKMNGAGNDFIYINNMEEHIPVEKMEALAVKLCERRMSIGADGLMIVDEPSDGRADYRMRFYNADGSQGEMCGNGARCICRYGYENGLAGEVQRVETIAGIVIGQRISERQYRIRLNEPVNFRFDEEIEMDGVVYKASYVELGDPGIPHVAIHIPDLKNYDESALFDLGRKFRYYEGYPKGANINFYDFVGENHLYERTYERGVEDFTYACGTGTGSVVTILALQGRLSGIQTKVDVKGGQLMIDVIRDEKDPGRVTDLYLTGPTNIVCKGEITDEELEL